MIALDHLRRFSFNLNDQRLMREARHPRALMRYHVDLAEAGGVLFQSLKATSVPSRSPRRHSTSTTLGGPNRKSRRDVVFWRAELHVTSSRTWRY